VAKCEIPPAVRHPPAASRCGLAPRSGIFEHAAEMAPCRVQRTRWTYRRPVMLHDRHAACQLDVMPVGCNTRQNTHLRRPPGAAVESSAGDWAGAGSLRLAKRGACGLASTKGLFAAIELPIGERTSWPAGPMLTRSSPRSGRCHSRRESLRHWSPQYWAFHSTSCRDTTWWHSSRSLMAVDYRDRHFLEVPPLSSLRARVPAQRCRDEVRL